MTTEQLMPLRDAGLISDNASCWEEVAPCDKARALEWIEQQRQNGLKAEQIEMLPPAKRFT